MTVLDPNRYAGPAEAAILRSDIAADDAARPALLQRAAQALTALHDATTALRAAQEAVDSAQKIYDHVGQLEASLEERTRVSRGLLHPIRRLPDEILSMIFLADVGCLEGPRCDHPFVVAAVCRRWRAVALCTPSLWATVSCDLPTVEATVQRVTYLNFHLDRSAQLPLIVYISYDAEGSAPGTLFSSALTKLFRRACDFTCTSSTDTTHMLSQCLSGRAPDLTKLCLDDTYFRGVSDTTLYLDFVAPRLELVHCTGSQVLWRGAAEYQSVRTLRLWTENSDTQVLMDVVSRFPQVVDLDVSCVGALHSPVDLNLRAERLTHLDLSIVGGMDINVARSFSFPSLRVAKIEIREGDTIRTGAMISFFHTALATVRELELNYDVGSGIAVGLQACLLLERLDLHIWRNDDNAVEILGILAAPPVNGDWWSCPHLHTLALSGRVKQTIADVLISLASARRPGATSGPPVALTKIEISSTSRPPRPPHDVDHAALQRRLDSLLV
ncbi:hypothetical protein EXIGLDRAFT_717839 [Exidia glandulosa HHB12029]|uniref:F-box domain-containing protein n=1 Tax=Exidia glandulosa HHB12029 TaxID=1314781 RepID=A0A165I471_EXIGL|nr:hypothetical protein EXIGLDRAFT_717839 [Exidia glandulosa HHB12029]